MRENVPITLEMFEEAKKYWLEKLAEELNEVRLLTDYPRTKHYEGASYKAPLGKDISEKLISRSKKNDLSLYVLLLTAFRIVVNKYTGQEDFVLISPTYSKSEQKYNRWVPLRDSLQPDVSFKEWLLQVNQTVLDGYKNQYYPFQKIIDSLGLKNGSSFFNVIPLLENIHKKEFVDEIIDEGVNEIILSFNKSGDKIEGHFIYNSQLFEKETIQRLFSHCSQVLSRVLDHTGIKIADIEMVSAREKKQLLFEFNDTKEEYPAGNPVHKVFEEQAAKRGGNMAVVSEESQLSYRELNKRANQLARIVKTRGIKADSVVGLMMERSLELIVGILAILKAGGAYLPIIPDYPEKRKKAILAGSEARLLVTQGDFIRDPVPVFENYILADEENIYANDCTNFESINTEEDLVYVIYTSGSTGEPKGVLIRHKGLVNCVNFHKHVFAQDHKSRLSQVANIGFDAFSFEIWPSLTSGASLHIVANELRVDPGSMKEWLIKNSITISFQPTIMAEQLLREKWPQQGVALKALRAAGDKLKYYPDRTYPFRFYNLYGPTEDTIWTTWVEVREEIKKGNFSNIGKPVANHQVYIIGSDLKLKPIGLVGELCISGDGLARGYLKDEALTKEKFIDHPFSPGEKLYKTGDLARWAPDGHIEFWGRRDRQVKIRGYRIEPGEIESQLLNIAAIREAVVVDRQDPNENRYLCAYIVGDEISEDNYALEILNIKKELLNALPEYMIPSFFIHLNKIPLLPGGKIDKKALPEPEIVKSKDCIAPRSETEKKIAEVWSNVLGIAEDTIGINSNFFELGGDSLKIIQLSNHLKELFLKDIPVVTFFEYPTISSLLDHLTRHEYISKDGIIKQEKLESIKDSLQETLNIFEEI
jgi:amino acid adenylation domain-containing protein